MYEVYEWCMSVEVSMVDEVSMVYEVVVDVLI